jgi:hypothetical protein
MIIIIHDPVDATALSLEVERRGMTFPSQTGSLLSSDSTMTTGPTSTPMSPSTYISPELLTTWIPKIAHCPSATAIHTQKRSV